MDFLAPFFAVAGIVAGTIPIVLHMLRRAPTKEMPFSLVRFLKPSQPKLTKRSNIEHWPLMLLRILALLLIALAFARPFLRQVIPLDMQDGSVQAVTILIDRSASMRRDGIYEKVQKLIRESTDELGEQDLLSVATFSDTSTTLLSREKWKTASSEDRAALVEGVLEAWEPDWMATNTGAAMKMAAEELAQESRDRLNIRQRRLVVITDFQRGSGLEELQSSEWPSGVEVELSIVEPDQRGNAGVYFVEDRRADRIRVRVSNAGDSVQQEFRLQPFDVSGAPVGESVRVSVAPGQRRSLVLPVANREDGRVVVGVELEGDEHPFDNVIDLPEVENPVVRVAHIGPSKLNDPESMRYYLQRVFDGNEERDIRLTDLAREDGVVLPVPDDVRLVVATDTVPPGLLDSISEFFDRSGTLLMAPPSAESVLSLKSFLPVNFEVKEAGVSEYAMFGQIDFDHPIFFAFSDARFADFSSIRFWRHRNLNFSEEDRRDGDWTIAAKFDSGLPAVVEVGVGESGRLILLAAGWHPTDSQLARSTRFPALLTQILSLASPAQKDQVVQTVGDVIRPGEFVSSPDWTMQLPDGETVSAEDVRSSSQRESADRDALSLTWKLTDPGRYTIMADSEEGETRVPLIARLAPAESRTEKLPVGQLQVLGIGVESNVDGQSESAENSSAETSNGQLNAGQLEREQKWWRWLLLSGLLLLIIESIWAASIEKRRAQQPA